MGCSTSQPVPVIPDVLITQASLTIPRLVDEEELKRRAAKIRSKAAEKHGVIDIRLEVDQHQHQLNRVPQQHHALPQVRYPTQRSDDYYRQVRGQYKKGSLPAKRNNDRVELEKAVQELLKPELLLMTYQMAGARAQQRSQ
ncbi:hypothetical protein LTR12_018194 [Friedmanniomyces endolithicus]|nr:hypothetical protein LTR74_018133 [Friedmanniomyces endolithicus]KAK1807458.1 hypothetical protein LTR12_018194 [Friedmanniomyces endolithicus]